MYESKGDGWMIGSSGSTQGRETLEVSFFICSPSVFRADFSKECSLFLRRARPTLLPPPRLFELVDGGQVSKSCLVLSYVAKRVVH